jgi:hypothetical protein
MTNKQINSEVAPTEKKAIKVVKARLSAKEDIHTNKVFQNMSEYIF